MAVRQRHKESFKERHGVGLGESYGDAGHIEQLRTAATALIGLDPFGLNRLSASLSDAGGGSQFAALASTWFTTVTNAHPVAADRVDWQFTNRHSLAAPTLDGSRPKRSPARMEIAAVNASTSSAHAAAKKSGVRRRRRSARPQAGRIAFMRLTVTRCACANQSHYSS